MKTEIRPSAKNPLQGLMPFTMVRSNPGECLLMAHPQIPFKPRGLMLFDLPERAEVTINRIGMNEQLTVCAGVLPARWFAQAQSFEQIAQALDEGKEPVAWGDWDPVWLGQGVQLGLIWPERVQANPIAVMWGNKVEHRLEAREL
jgi:hypothetical protein